MNVQHIIHTSGAVLSYVAPVVVLVAIIAVMNTTNPLTVGPAGILLLLALMYIWIVCICNAAITAVSAVAARFYTVTPAKKKQLRYMSTVVAFGPVLLLALNSIGQTSPVDVVLVVIFTLLGCFYIARRSGVSAGHGTEPVV